MSEQERERNKADVEAHRLSAGENEDPSDEERTESTDDDEVEAHRVRTRNKS